MKSFGCLCADSGCLASVASQNESLYFSASLILAEGDLDNGPEPAKWVEEIPNTSVACYISILCSALRPETVCDEYVPIPGTARWGPLPTLCMISELRDAEIDLLQQNECRLPWQHWDGIGAEYQRQPVTCGAFIWVTLTVPCRCGGRKRPHYSWMNCFQLYMEAFWNL